MKEIEETLKIRDIHGTHHTLKDPYLIKMIIRARKKRGKDKKDTLKELSRALNRMFYSDFSL